MMFNYKVAVKQGHYLNWIVACQLGEPLDCQPLEFHWIGLWVIHNIGQ